MKKPVIAYIESKWYSGHDDDNPYRDALNFFLRKHCGCEVILYDYDRDFEDDLPRLKKYFDSRQIILVIVKQERYSSVQHERVIRSVRSVSSSLPVVVIPDGCNEERFVDKPDESVFAFSHTDKELAEFVKYLIIGWKPPLGWLGAETEQDQSTLMVHLENAYAKHYLAADDERMFGTPDSNHMVVAEALRIKILPAQLLKAEFDYTIEPVCRLFVPAPPSVYMLERKKIARMTDEERLAFDESLMRARGHEPSSGGGVYVTRANCGDNVNGFAIDPVTLETLITYQFGMHHAVGDLLSHRIVNIEALKRCRDRYELTDDEERNCRWRLITGLIFSELNGFKTPILQLYTYEAEPENVQRVARFLAKQQMFIPVAHGAKLIEG